MAAPSASGLANPPSPLSRHSHGITSRHGALAALQGLYTATCLGEIQEPYIPQALLLVRICEAALGTWGIQAQSVRKRAKRPADPEPYAPPGDPAPEVPAIETFEERIARAQRAAAPALPVELDAGAERE